MKDKPEDLKTQMKFLRVGKGEGGGADNQGGLGEGEGGISEALDEEPFDREGKDGVRPEVN